MATRNRHGRAALVGLVVAVGVIGVGCSSSPTVTSGAPGTSGPGTTSPAPGSTVTGASPPGTASGVPGTAVPGPASLTVVKTPYGDAIGTADGKVLYAWDREGSGAAVCTDAACVEKWPPLEATEIRVASGLDAARFTLVARPDGTEQVALDGRRLYHMMIDEPGEANCQGADGWWILRPDGTKNTSQTPM